MTDAMVTERKALLLVGERHRTASVRVLEPEGLAQVTVIYFHRFGGYSLEFIGPAQALVAAGCRVVCPEMFGHPGSEWLSEEEYSLRHATAIALSLLQEYSSGPILLVGNDWGGHVAIRAQAESSAEVFGIFLFDFVHSVRFTTDILMPLEYEAARIVADNRKAFAKRIGGLVHGMGKFGMLMASHLISRAREVDGTVSTFVDPRAYTPFRVDPLRVFTSVGGPNGTGVSCDVVIVNGTLANVKNLQIPVPAGRRPSERLHFVPSERLSFFEWSGQKEAEGILRFLRKRGFMQTL